MRETIDFKGYLLILKEGIGNKVEILFLHRKGSLVHLNILSMIILIAIFYHEILVGELRISTH